MLKSINLKRVKKFKDTTIELCPFTILMGENSSGKSTVLQAINLSLSIFSNTDLYSINGDDIKIRSKGIGTTELPGMNIADYRELYYAKSSRNGQKSPSGTNIGAVISVVDSLNNTYKLQVSSLFGGYNLKCLSSKEDLRNNPVFCKKNPLFISGFVGLQIVEERSFPVAIRHKLSTGNASTIIRNLVLDLKESEPEKYEALCKRLASDFGFFLESVTFNRQTDQYVTAHYNEKCESKKLSLDFNSSGSGFMQILQILAPIYSFCPNESRVVLLDEPDAHLHPNLQTSLAKSLREIQKELNIQIIISTHSTNIIRSAKATEVVPISSLNTVNSPLTSSDEVEQIIVDKLDAYEIGKTIISGKLVFFEDSNISIFERFDKILGVGCFSGVNTVPVITGRGKDDKIPFQLNDVFEKYLSKSVEIYFVRDGDGMTDEWRDKLKTYAESKKVKLCQLKRHEVENYILEPYLIHRALGVKFPEQDTPSLNDITIKLTTFLSDTISKSKYGYDDTLEDCIYKTAVLLGDSTYRNPDLTKRAADTIRSKYEEYNNISDLLNVGSGKECKRLVFEWLNSIGFNMSIDDILQCMIEEDITDEIKEILKNFKSVISDGTQVSDLESIVDEEDLDDEVEQFKN